MVRTVRRNLYYQVQEKEEKGHLQEQEENNNDHLTAAALNDLMSGAVDDSSFALQQATNVQSQQIGGRIDDDIFAEVFGESTPTEAFSANSRTPVRAAAGVDPGRSLVREM